MTPEATKRRIATAEDLQAITRTMKALSAASIRQYEEAVAALGDYARTVEQALQVLLRARPHALRRPPEPARIGAIVVGSDHGLCGAFNEQVAELCVRRRPAAGRPGGEPLVVVGARAAGRLEDLGRRPAAVLALPASVTRVPALVGDLLEHVAAWRAAGAVDGVRLYYNAPRAPGGHGPREEPVLPLDDGWLRALAARPWRPRALPTFAGQWEECFSAAVQQHLFVTVHRAVAQSLASEHASRLVAMHAAERNIEERLAGLRGEFHRQRQDAITTELLDIVSGVEALTPRSA